MYNNDPDTLYNGRPRTVNRQYQNHHAIAISICCVTPHRPMSFGRKVLGKWDKRSGESIDRQPCNTIQMPGGDAGASKHETCALFASAALGDGDLRLYDQQTVGLASHAQSWFRRIPAEDRTRCTAVGGLRVNQH